ncbi:MAG: sugar ABC transporter permease [Actinobacteria bacterium]|nr:sugar ABC transporter permease [Actinomycetota bacterium]
MPYALLIPAFIFLILTFFYPVINLFQLAMFGKKGDGYGFTGINNIKILFGDSVYITALKNNMLMLLIVVPLLIIISLVIAVLLFEKLAGWKFYRFVLFLPYILAIPVAGIVFQYLFQQNGVLNFLLKSIGLESLALNWLGSPKYAMFTIMFIIIWKEVGLGIVIFLARLMSVDETLYEASEIDGANWLQRLLHVTVPQLAAQIQFYFIFSMITILSWVFNYVYVITAGGPGHSTYIMELYIYYNTFKFGLPHIASMASIILLAIVSVLIFIQYKVRGGLIGSEA